MAKKEKIEEAPKKKEWIDDFEGVLNEIDEKKPTNKTREMLIVAIDMVKKKYVKVTKELNKGGK
jgi:hypothetical protein